jgi:hypothetical protein
VNFQDFTPYIDLLKCNDTVYARVDDDQSELNRLFTKRTIGLKLD